MTYPASLTTRTIAGTLLDIDGAAVEGATIRLIRTIQLHGPGDDTTLLPGEHTDTTDANGAYSLAVPVNDDADWSPSGWAYTLVVTTATSRYQANIAVPTGATTSLADLTPVTTTAPDDAATYVLKASIGTADGPAGPLDGGELLPVAQVPDLSGTYTPRAYAGASTLAAPLLSAAFTDIPATSDANLAEAYVTIAGQSKLATWLNEALRYRAEQLDGGLGYDNLITLIGAYAAVTGVLIRFERRNSSDQRVTTGGIDQDGRLQTSLYSWADIASLDPGATGRYTEDATAGVSPLAVRLETDDRVWLRGRVAVNASGTTSGQVICVVPSGYAPTYSQLLPVPTTGGIAAPCEVVASTGEVVARRTQSGAFSLSFDGLSYAR